MHFFQSNEEALLGTHRKNVHLKMDWKCIIRTSVGKNPVKKKNNKKTALKVSLGFIVFFLVILGFIGVFNIEVVEKALLKALLKAY